MKKNRKFVLSAVCSAVLAACYVVPAVAQTHDDDDKKEAIEKISVRGFAASQEKNLNIKRFSDTVVDAVTAEDVGKFPDQTVADALQRVPGVSVEKDFGESDRVSIRGTAPHLNVTLLNGQNVASATAQASILTPSRGFNYSLLPAEMIERLEVHKSAEADVEEGSVGGTVIIRTRTPLAMDANFAALSLKNTYQQANGEHSPNLSAAYSWKNADANFGVALAAAYKDNRVQRDSREVRFGYRDTVVNGQNVKYPGSVGNNRFESQNKLKTLHLTLESQPTARWNLVFNNLFSDVDNNGQGSYSGSYNLSAIGSLTNAVVANNTVVSGNIPAAASGFEAIFGSAGYIGGYQTRAHDLKLSFDNNQYLWTTQFGYTYADGVVEDNYAEFYAKSAIAFDVSNTVPQMSLPDISSAAAYWLGYNHVNTISNEDQEKYIQTDLTYRLEHDIFQAVKFGLKYKDHEKSSDLFKETRPSTINTRLSDYTSGTVDDFMGSGSSPAQLYQFRTDLWANYLAQTPTNSSYTHVLYYYNIAEKISNAYLKGDFSFDKLRGNLGLRYAKTELETQGWEYTGSVINPTTKTLRTLENSYTDVLPSLNLNYELQDDVILRFAAAKVMARPDYQHLTAQRTYSLNNGLRIGSGGNPYLNPYRATQYDLSAEWYFGPRSILSAAYFYKDIKSYITQSTQVESLPDPDGTLNNYEITLPVNGLGGVNQGIELNLSHHFGSGFGVVANYTFSDADMDETPAQQAAGIKAILPNNSKHLYNLTGYYEQGPYSARLSYSYRSEYYYGTYLGLSQYLKSYGQYDLNLSYDLNDNVAFSLQVINLSNADQERYFKDPDRTIGEFNFGRRIMAGVQLRF